MVEYKIYPKSGFGYIDFEKLTAIFYDLELAKDFVDYQTTLGKDYSIFCSGEEVKDEL